VGYTTEAEWNEHYQDGRTFRRLGDAERALIEEHLPASAGSVALEIGSGLGELARHLAATGYRVDAVDYAEAAIDAAREQTDPASAVTYARFDIETGDLDDLPHAVYDLVVFRQSFAFVRDRTRVVTRLRERLRPGGALCVITPLADGVPDGKRDIALDDGEIALLSAGWRHADRHDADALAFIVLRDPVVGPVAVADKRRPAPQGLVGVGVVVTDPLGRVLLGRSVRDMWELPGGKPAITPAGLVESVEDTAARELMEETGLAASPDDARVLALLTDTTHGIVRETTAVRIAAFTGKPSLTEPKIFSRWEWHEVSDLPHLASTLFTPSAHVLETVWPGLFPSLPPVSRRLFRQRPRPEDPQQAVAARRLREAMTQRLREQGWITDDAVADAFGWVERHRFMPGADLETAYGDMQFTTKTTTSGASLSSVSAPWLQAHMLREAAITRGQTVVEIGSGGCNAAYAQELVGDRSRVITMDIDPYVTDRAARFLADTGYDRITVLLGDGTHGAPAHLGDGGADAILVTVEARDIPPAWREQLADGGRLVVPLRVHGFTWAIAFDKRGEHLVSRSWQVCGFVPMQGASRRADAEAVLREGRVRLVCEEGPLPDTSRLDEALASGRLELATGVTVAGNEPFDSLQLWLSVSMPGFCRLTLHPGGETVEVLPPRTGTAPTVVRDNSLAYLYPRQLHKGEQPSESLYEFEIHAFGPHREQLAQALADQVRIWERDLRHAGRPELIVQPPHHADAEDTGVFVLDKPGARLRFRFPLAPSAKNSSADSAPAQPALAREASA
jgi:protein-L-isoaspartate(D-aspartate) O-methyltransferase